MQEKFHRFPDDIQDDFGTILDELLTSFQIQDKSVNSNPHENKTKEPFIRIIEEEAENQEYDEDMIGYKNKISCLAPLVDRSLGNKHTYIDIIKLVNCIVTLPEYLLESFWQEHYKDDPDKMNWAKKIMEVGKLSIEELKMLINPGPNARTYWYLSLCSLIKFVYQSNKHFGAILKHLDASTLYKINNIVKDQADKGQYGPEKTKYHKFLHECFSQPLLDILAKVNREMSTTDNRLCLVPATKELLTIVMGEVDPTNFRYKRNFYNYRKELQNLEGKINGEIKKRLGKLSNYRDTIVATCKRMELQFQSSNGGASVFVDNLHYFTTEQELGDAFDRYGFVKSVKIILDSKFRRSRGFGFVEFFNLDLAKNAISYMDGYYLRGRALRVSASVFVDNLHYVANEQELAKAFARYGRIRDVKIKRDRETGRPKGFGFVEFYELAHSAEAMRQMHGKKLLGRPLWVRW